MPVQPYVVRKQDRLWEVWLGKEMVSSQPSYVEALNVAEALVRAAVQRGEPSRMMIGTFDGVAVEFPIRPLPQRPSADRA